VRKLLILGTLLLFGVAPAPRPSHYLFAWAMEASAPSPGMRSMPKTGRDFLAVFDVASDAKPFGRLVAMLPVGGGAKMAHHTDYALPPDDVLFANDWLANRTYAIDLHDAAHPHLKFQFGSIGSYQYPHSFAPLANGDTLATFQYSGGFNHAAGGLVEFDASGHVVKSGSAASPKIDRNIRPYSMAVVAKLDRVVTSSADMMGAQVSHVLQVWRLSDLKLLETIVLPKPGEWYNDPSSDSSEPRLLADGITVAMPTFNCGLFVVRGLDGEHPTVRHVYDFGYRVCEVPIVVGDYLVESMQSGHAVVSLDMHDPLHPHEVGRILLKPDEYPHWLGIEPNGNRIVITGIGALRTHALFATIDRATGKLALDPKSIDFTRAWPDGWRGSAIPHGSVFSNE